MTSDVPKIKDGLESMIVSLRHSAGLFACLAAKPEPGCWVPLSKADMEGLFNLLYRAAAIIEQQKPYMQHQCVWRNK
jgi:hypothetical protein